MNDVGDESRVGQPVARPPSAHLWGRNTVVVLWEEVTLQCDRVLPKQWLPTVVATATERPIAPVIERRAIRLVGRVFESAFRRHPMMKASNIGWEGEDGLATMTTKLKTLRYTSSTYHFVHSKAVDLHAFKQCILQ